MAQDDQQIDLDEWERRTFERYGVPENLRRSIIGQESGGDVNAKSPTGVKGRYQVTRATAQQYGYDRDDPWQQPVAAAKHLRTLYDGIKKRNPDFDDKTAWLGASAEYYYGGDAFDRDGNLSEKSRDGFSTPAKYATSIAERWSAFDKGVSPQSSPELPSPAPKQSPRPKAQNAPIFVSDPGKGKFMPDPGERVDPLGYTQDAQSRSHELLGMIESFERAKLLGDKRTAQIMADDIKRGYGKWVEVGEGGGWPYVKPRRTNEFDYDLNKVLEAAAIDPADELRQKELEQKRREFERKPVLDQWMERGTEALARGGGHLSKMARQTIQAGKAVDKRLGIPIFSGVGAVIPESAMEDWKRGDERTMRELEERRQGRPSSFTSDVVEGVIEGVPAAAAAIGGAGLTGGGLPAMMAMGGGMSAAGADWNDPKRAAAQTALGAVGPVAGGVLGSRAGGALAGQLSRPALQSAARAGGELIGGAAGNVIGAGAEQLAFDGGLDPRELTKQAVIGAAMNVPGAMAVARRPAVLSAARPTETPQLSPQEQSDLNIRRVIDEYTQTVDAINRSALPPEQKAIQLEQARAAYQAERGVTPRQPQAIQFQPWPRTPQGAVIAQPSSLPSRKLLPPAPSAPETQPIPPRNVIYPDAPPTNEMPHITAENAPTTDQPIIPQRRTAEIPRAENQLPPPAIIQEPTNRITEGEGAELPRRVSRPFEGQPIEIPGQTKDLVAPSKGEFGLQRSPSPSKRTTETDETIDTLRARRDELNRVAFDRRGDFTGDLRDEYDQLNATIRDYDNARASRELGPPEGIGGQEQGILPEERQARRNALQRPRASGILQSSTPGRPVTQETQIPSSIDPKTYFGSREDARRGYFDTLTDDELVAEIRRLEDVRNAAVRGQSKLTPDQLEAARFDHKIAVEQQKERRAIQQAQGRDEATRIPGRTPGQRQRKQIPTEEYTNRLRPNPAYEGAELQRYSRPLEGQPVELPEARTAETAYPRGQENIAKMRRDEFAERYAQAITRPPSRDNKAARDLYANQLEQNRNRALRVHATAVKYEIGEGKPVSPEVLADYPDLQPKSAEPAPQQEATPTGRKIQHSKFGEVTESSDQSSVPRGKLRVTDASGEEHLIQNPRARGKGNRNAAFVKAEEAQAMTTVKPTGQEQKTVVAKVKQEKVDARTGLTKSQQTYLADKLKNEVLPQYIETPKEKPITIKVPGDGKFTVRDITQVNNLHYRVTGQPINEMLKPTVKRGMARKPSPPPIPASAETGAARMREAYGSNERALKAVENQLRAFGEDAAPQERRQLFEIAEALRERVKAEKATPEDKAAEKAEALKAAREKKVYERTPQEQQMIDRADMGLPDDWQKLTQAERSAWARKHVSGWTGMTPPNQRRWMSRAFDATRTESRGGHIMGMGFGGLQGMFGKRSAPKSNPTKADIESASFGKMAGNALGRAGDEVRALWTSLDFSAPLSQGALLTLAHPVKAAGSFGKMFRSLSKSQSDAIDTAITSHPLAKLGEDSGLFLATVEKLKGGARAGEEAYRGSAVAELPGFRHSERAYRTYLDSLRMSTWESYVKALQASGHTFENNPKAFRDAASFINIATGRGQLKPGGKLEKASDIMGNVLFAPRNMIANFQVLDPVRYMSLAPGARKVVIRDAMTAFGVMVGTAALLRANGVEVGFNPEDDDFMVARSGNTRYDLTFGKKTQVQFLARMAMGLYRQGAGEGNLPGKDPLSVASRFAQSKLSPVLSTAKTFITGRDFKGESVADKSKAQIAWETAAPMLARDMVEAYKEEGKAGVVKTLPAILGARVNTYPDRAKADWIDTPDALRSEQKKFSQTRSFLTPHRGESGSKDDETPAQFAARRKLANEWTDKYGNSLVSSNVYKSAKPDEQKAALEYLKRTIANQTNEKRPSLYLFRPALIFQSIRETARNNRRKKAGF